MGYIAQNTLFRKRIQQQQQEIRNKNEILLLDVRSWFATKIHIVTKRTRQVITSADPKSKGCVDVNGAVIC